AKKQSYFYTRLILNYSAQTPKQLWSVTQRGATLAEMQNLSTIFEKKLTFSPTPSPDCKTPDVFN
ncbi:MAG: hypothetical protein AB7E95_06940, partial [Kiritimatiellales bacterium]